MQVGADFFQEGGLQSEKLWHFELPSEDLWRQNALHIQYIQYIQYIQIRTIQPKMTLCTFNKLLTDSAYSKTMRLQLDCLTQKLANKTVYYYRCNSKLACSFWDGKFGYCNFFTVSFNV